MTLESLPLVLTAIGAIIAAVLGAMRYPGDTAAKAVETSGENQAQMLRLRDEALEELERCRVERDELRAALDGCKKRERELQNRVKGLER